MSRKASWAYPGLIRTELDRVLSARAERIHLRYPLLRLILTRFAWCSDGVERRARNRILSWIEEELLLVVAEAAALGVAPDRYFRNLFDVLPEWLKPVLGLALTHHAKLRDLFPGLDVDILSASSDPAEARILNALLSVSETALSPEDVAIIVPLRPVALEKARARWKRRRRVVPLDGEKRGRGKQAQVPNIDALGFTKSSALPTSLGRPDAPNAPSISPIQKRSDVSPSLFSASKDLQARWEQLEEDLLAAIADQAPLIAFLKRAALNQDTKKWAYRCVLNRLGDLRRLPRHAAPELVQYLASESTFLPLASLRIFAAGRENALSELIQLGSKDAVRVLNELARGVNAQLLLRLVRDIQPDWVATEFGNQLSVKTARLICAEALGWNLPAKLFSLLIARWRKLGPGPWRNRLVSRIQEMDAKTLRQFIVGAARVTAHSKLPLTVREGFLEAWSRNRAECAELPKLTARFSPTLALDAARWCHDAHTVAELLESPSCQLALSLQKVAPKSFHTGWTLAMRRARKSRSIPEPLLEEAKTNIVLLDRILKDAFRAFEQARLDGLDVAVLAQHGLRARWFGARLDKDVGRDVMLAALPSIQKRLKGRPRILAATEICIIAGFEYGSALKYFSTRPFAKKGRIGTRFDQYYRTWKIPKKRGGSRQITAPSPLLMTLQRRLVRTVLHDAPYHQAATGFRTALSIADNALPHVGKKVVVNVDIAGFFPSTGFWLIRRGLDRACPSWLSGPSRRLLADLCAYHAALPTGAPTSPAIANLVLAPADEAISKAAKRAGISYTRYADDLTFSGDNPVGILPFIRDVLAPLGYTLDRKKTNIFRRGRRQVVTGLVVNSKVSVPRSMRRKLRAAVHRAVDQSQPSRLEWHKKPMSVQQLEGRIAFVGVAHPALSDALRKKLRSSSKGS